ncbi:guanine deaminase [Marinobacterium sediminicola]|uniref:Guanine deaminase n=1 Tax=Marinobacterium sediminicola TaxID=518898 RepID=A0ABY1S391_9GAMM|nr:guanine deaminase [Marinobacterium sediminicola]ULG68851.1 guanine deaminase [Marinobacterium sediminicola]SMR77539.1 guanine deaminase [Marinobacterium sediminicola]
MEPASSSRILRGAIVDCLDDPAIAGESAVRYFEDGLLWIKDGRVHAVGTAGELAARLPANVDIEDRRGGLLVPGLIDTHTHYPQLSVAGSPSGSLFEWLERRAFPAESALAQPGLAEVMAHRFIAEMLRNGTTTAMVFAGVQPESADAFFQHAQHLGLRMVAGKVLQDRMVPEALREAPEQTLEATDRLIQRWHGRDRLAYALTPRFAPACSEMLLSQCRDWLRQSPSLYLQTHLAETEEECDRVAKLFPRDRGYLDLYDRFGFLRAGTIFAHAIYLQADEQRRLGESGAAVAHCPSSNLLLGSGLMPLRALQDTDVLLSVGTDVGAGPSCSVLKTLADAIRVQQLRGEPMGMLQAFYLATLGGARALKLEQQIGSFRVGNEADFLVLDLEATPELAERTARANSLEELMGLLILLGDDRLVVEVNIQGRRLIPVGA